MAKDLDWSQFEEVTTPGAELDWSQFQENSSPQKSWMLSEAFSGKLFDPKFWESVSDLGTGFRHGVEEYTHGILSPIAGILGGRAKRGFDANRQEQLTKYDQSKERSPIASRLGAGVGAAGVLAPLAGLLPSLGSGIIPAAAEGALTGGISGFAKMPGEGETRSENAAWDAGFGGLLGAAFGAGGKVANAVKGKSSEQALKGIATAEKEALAPAIAKYDQLGNILKQEGKDLAFEIPKNINWDDISKKVNAAEIAPIKKLLSEGTYESFNKAQSLLSDAHRALKAQQKVGGSTTSAINALRNAEKKVHGKLFERFQEVDPSLGRLYQEANELYAKGIKNFEVPALREYQGLVKEFGKVTKDTSDKTIKHLLGNDRFVNALPNQAEALKRAQDVEKILNKVKWGLGTAATAVGSTAAYNALTGKRK